MERLTGSDFQQILEFTGNLYAVQNHKELIERIVKSFQILIRGDVHSYTETNHRENTATLVDGPGGPVLTQAEKECYAQFSLQHPTIAYYRETGDLQACKISDFLSSSDWLKTDLYNQVYRPHRMRYNIGAGLALGRSQDLVLGFGVTRGKKEFSERDRTILNLVRPHLLQAYWNGQVVTRMQERIAALSRAMDQLDQAAVEVGKKGKIVWATDKAKVLLQKIGKRRNRKAANLPSVIWNWTQGSLKQLADANNIPFPVTPLYVKEESSSIVIRLVQDRDTTLLILEEHLDTLPLDRLNHLGLSRRETEVLGWLARGKSNPEIAEILGIRVGTVKTHLERIYDKLGVDHRHAAMSLALEMLGKG